MRIDELTRRLEDRLTAVGCPERAEAERRYLKSDLAFIGVAAGRSDRPSRNASLLSELRPIRHGAPLDRFLARAGPMLDEKKFFIRKAIGWVLREASKKRPDDIAAWVAPRTHRASGVTMREAVKYLPAAGAQRLMTAYREKRPAS